MSLTSQWVLSIFLCLCVIVLPLPGSSLRRAFPVDLSSFTDQEIYDLNREVVDQEESFEPYEPSLFPVYEKLVDDTNIYDVLKSPAIEHVKSRKIAFSLEQPQARPPFDRITQISDAHDVSKRFPRPDFVSRIGRFIETDVCSSNHGWLGPLETAQNEKSQLVHLYQNQWFWVTLCNEAGADCMGVSTFFASRCIQRHGWAMAWGRRYPYETWGWHRISIPSCCSCGIKEKYS
ncbi:uncharacterized protein [Apostichopus japonicus]|uniref:uncharacterized protein isoform X1 n=1 Tax=Stichopus japonicus TaxID=307972 RepID=UPI003AB147AE